MRILRLKFSNLNSLKGKWEVNFEKPPFQNAGLFAITGPTGSGKSTLLDAITLALYGRAARYAAVANPEDMMSRHCGECTAEVEFTVAKGTFRAEWQLRRARNRPDGKLQGAKRYVYDAGGQILAEKIGDVESLIVALIGLDYQRFLRSVLLAQGDFARFLKANPNERAELLESLTGTIIYSELSELAHVEATRRDIELSRKELALGEVVLLKPEELHAIEHRIEEAEGKLSATRSIVTQLNKALDQARQLKTALLGESELSATKQALETRKSQAQPSLLRLARHRITTPFADDLSRIDAANEFLENQREKLCAASKLEAAANEAWLACLGKALSFCRVAIREVEETVLRQQRELASQEAQKKTEEVWLLENANDKNIERLLPEWVVQLNTIETLRSDNVKAREGQGALASQLRTQEGIIETANASALGLLEALKQAETAKAAANLQLKAALAGKSEEDRKSNWAQLQIQLQALGMLVALQESSDKAERDLSVDNQTLREFEAGLSSAVSAHKDVLSIRTEAFEAISRKREELQKAQLIANFDDHRVGLKPGEPCPLCGGLEHPYTDPNQTWSSMQEFAADLKRLEDDLSTADARLRAAESLITTLTTQRLTLLATISRNEVDLETARKRRNDLAAQSGLSQEGTTWASVKEETQRLNDEVKAEIDSIEKAKQRLAGCETGCMSAEHSLGQATQTKHNEERRLLQLRDLAAEHAKHLLSQEDKVRSYESALEVVLKPFQISVPGSGLEKTTRAALQLRKEMYQQHEQSLREVIDALKETKFSVESANNAMTALKGKAAPVIAAGESFEGEIEKLPPEGIDCGETEWRTFQDVELSLGRFERELATAQAAVKERSLQCDQSSLSLDKMLLNFSDRLDASSFNSIEEVRECRLSHIEATELEALEGMLKSESDQLDGRLQEISSQIRQLRQARVAEGEAEIQLASELQSTQATAEALITAIASFHAELIRDTDNRLKHHSKAAEIRKEKDHLQIWRQLQGLIGSHDGSKFRRYAQGISLDILIQRANHHLCRLSDRYRARRHTGEELELIIEDLFQAGATRPMASLSGGESFLASLALALGLADLAGRNVRIECLFIDEGFGTLDPDTLDLAIGTLEGLQQQNKRVGVISHIELMKERIATQIVIDKLPGGVSALRFVP